MTKNDADNLTDADFSVVPVPTPPWRWNGGEGHRYFRQQHHSADSSQRQL